MSNPNPRISFQTCSPDILPTPSKPTSFHLFPRLPFELQRQIWEHALPPPSEPIFIYFPRYRWQPLPKFQTTGLNAQILQDLGPLHHPALPPIEAVHIPDENYVMHTVYLRPNIDIIDLYSICLTIDRQDRPSKKRAVDIFLANEDNQRNLKTIAISGRDIDSVLANEININKQMMRIIDTGAKDVEELAMPEPQTIARAFRELKGLKVIYVMATQNAQWTSYKKKCDSVVGWNLERSGWVAPEMRCAKISRRGFPGETEKFWVLDQIDGP